MREWKRCPGCGYIKCGSCSMCFPAQAEWERQQEIAESVAAEEDRARREAGMLLCPEHDRHDGCWTFRRPEPEPERRTLTWEEAMRQLRDRYVP